MAKEDRVALIKELQKARDNAVVICYVTSTKPNLGYQIADDAVRLIYEHLEALPKEPKPKIDLFLYSGGGSGTVPWRLVNLIREYTSNFEVLIPYKAYSAATLVALGADKIWMHPMGELGPVDPKVSNEYNPVDGNGRTIGINVEDVASYISFLKDYGITDQKELIQGVNILETHVHPLALGNVHRFYSQARMIGKKLLLLHMSKKQGKKITNIIDQLTAKLYYHGHPINRQEAKELGLKVERPKKEMADLMWKLYLEFEKELDLKTPFMPVTILNRANQDRTQVSVKGVYIQSENKCDYFSSDIELVRFAVPPNTNAQDTAKLRGNAQITVLQDGWKTE
jgi:hypothetical protein